MSKNFQEQKDFFFGASNVCKNSSQSVQGYSQEEGQTNRIDDRHIEIYRHTYIHIRTTVYKVRLG